MPELNYTINLDHYKKQKILKKGNTNTVTLWIHKVFPSKKIVVKEPRTRNKELVKHNIKTINAFFDKTTAWPVMDGKGEKSHVFAMQYFEGEPISPEEFGSFSKEKLRSLRELDGNGSSFIYLNLDSSNFLKVPGDKPNESQIIITSFNYLVMTDGSPLLEYQKDHLSAKIAFYIRTNYIFAEHTAAIYQKAEQLIFDQYSTIAAQYLTERWGQNAKKLAHALPPAPSHAKNNPILQDKIRTNFFTKFLPSTQLNKDKELKEKQGSYNYLLSDITLKKFNQYQSKLANDELKAGINLQQQLKNKNLSLLSVEEFIECLIRTKKKCIFAERINLKGDQNWNGTEVSLLGDVSWVVECKAYDDGKWSNPTVHEVPFNVTLIYVPGALLRVAHSQEKPDFKEICPLGEFDFESYYKLYERRILPGLLHVNQKAKDEGEFLFITLPGIGCGQFAGNFMGKGGIKTHFQQVIVRLLTEHGNQLTQVKGVYYDNYMGDSFSRSISGIDLLVGAQGRGGKPLLCPPHEYGDKYKDCRLVSIVAGDGLSYPGNEYWLGTRNTDDGARTGGTDALTEFTGTPGVYNPDQKKYVPKNQPNSTWSEVITQEKIMKFPVADKLIIYPLPPSVNRPNNDAPEPDYIHSNLP